MDTKDSRQHGIKEQGLRRKKLCAVILAAALAAPFAGMNVSAAANGQTEQAGQTEQTGQTEQIGQMEQTGQTEQDERTGQAGKSLHDEVTDKVMEIAEKELAGPIGEALADQIVEPAKEAAEAAVKDTVRHFWQDLKDSVISFFEGIFGKETQ